MPDSWRKIGRPGAVETKKKKAPCRTDAVCANSVPDKVSTSLMGSSDEVVGFDVVKIGKPTLPTRLYAITTKVHSWAANERRKVCSRTYTRNKSSG